MKAAYSENFKISFTAKLQNLWKKKLHYSKKLYIYLGEYDDVKKNAIRKEIEKNSFLLYIHPTQKDIPLINLQNDFFTISLNYNDNINLTIENIWFTISASMFREIKISYQNGLPKSLSDQVERIMNEANDALTYVTFEKVSRLIKIRCSILNIPRIVSSKGTIINKITPSAPALICGAGPSIYSQFDLLRQEQSNFIIIAVGAMEEILVNQNIFPDVVVQVDPTHEISIKGNLSPDTTLVALTNTSPKLISQFDKIIWANGDCHYFNLFLEKYNIKLNELSFSNSATITALDFANKVNCCPVALIGNDLCLSDKGFTHVTNYSENESFKIDTTKIESSDGTMIKTTTEFKRIRTEIEEYLKSHSDLRVFNCTKSGAKIKYAIPLDLKEFLKEKNCYKGKKSIYKCHLTTIDKKKRLNYKKINEDPIWEKTAEVAACEIILDMPEPDFTIQKELTSNIFMDIKNTLKCITEIPPSDSISPLLFGSFRKFALSFIKKNNPDFELFLSANFNLSTISEKFKLRLNWQDLPQVMIKSKNQPTLNLSGNFLSMETNARKDIKSFTSEHNYNSEKDGVIFIAPGNWMHVIEFAKNYPYSKIIVIEPWPELLALLINFSIFMQYLPTETLIIGACKEVSTWKDIYRKQVNNWRSKSIRKLFFYHPITKNIPEIQNLIEKISH